MNTFLGMSVEKGGTAGEAIGALAKELQSAAGAAQSTVGSAEWVGEDREAFVAAWAQIHSSVEQLVQAMQTYGGRLIEEASQQTSASAAA